MAYDSLIRLRQLNTGDIYNFISQNIEPILSGEGLNLTSNGSILPTINNISNIGSATLPYYQGYINQLNLASGSGIYFGPTFFNAFTSGNAGIIQVGGYTITSNSQGLSIIGPTGPSGASGLIGPTGLSITGYVQSGNNIAFIFSNNITGNFIFLPSGATGIQGPTGTSMSGFLQSGNYLLPLYTNKTTGIPFLIASGAQGPPGPIGAININFYNFTGINSGQVPPLVYVNGLGGSNPTLNLVNGMTYTFNYSGLNLSGINYQGTGYTGNFFIDDGVTGYLRFAVFNPSIFGFPVSNPNYFTGRFLEEEFANQNYFGSNSTTTLANLENYDFTSLVFNNLIESNLYGSITANVNFGNAYSTLVYGFEKYALSNQQIIGVGQDWGFYALGTINLSNFGPQGLSGQQGIQGIPGPQGNPGGQGNAGNQGVSIVSVNTNGYQIQFNFSNSTQSQWITLPSGGPTGATGPVGPSGPSGQQGLIGPQGPTGFGDTYYSTFLYTDTSYNGTGNAIYWNPSGTSSWLLLTGANRIFAPGDEIQFYNNGLIGHAYSSMQTLIFADTPASRNQYFYGEVESYNSNNGLIQVLVLNSPAPLGLVNDTGINLNNYATISVNLGGLGSPGASGQTGPTGAQGQKGNTGQAYFNILNPISGNLGSNNTYIFNFNTYDFWNLSITGSNNLFLFNWSTFNTGQTVMFRIYNSGVLNNNNEPPLVSWDPSVNFPYSVSAPMPNPGQSNIYTFLRLPNNPSTPGSPLGICTYSVAYGI